MKKENLLVGTSVAGALLVSSCCMLPFVLFSVGITGAWLGNLAALEPLRPVFGLVAVAALIAGFYVVQKRRAVEACSTNGYCATPVASRVRLTILILSAIIIAIAIAWPVLLPWLLGPTT